MVTFARSGLLLAAVAALLSLFAGNANAQNSAAPALDPGRLVYGIPEGYVNPAVGAGGVARLEQQLHALHHPFYVVFMDRLPGNGDPNAEATRTVDDVAAAWRAARPDLYTAHASLFLQVTNPRKYRISPGSRWAAELGLVGEQVTRFGNEHFVPYMRMRPEDPVAGILETTRAIDLHVFEATDPEILRLRREAAIRAAEERQRAAEAMAAQRRAEEHAQALRDLGNETLRATSLLANDERYLPANLGPHAVAMENARMVQERGDAATQTVIDARSRLQGENNALEEVINSRKSDESTATAYAVLKWALAALAAIALLAAAIARTRTVRKLREELADLVRTWTRKVDDALVRYAAFSAEADAMRSLADKRGLTAKLYRETTAEVDEIVVLIEAMRTHLLGCSARGVKGGFFNLDPLREAIGKVEARFVFDTEVMDPTRLFHPQTVQKKVKPTALEDDLATRYAAAMDGWNDLREALYAGGRDPRADLPLAALDDLRARATAGNVPHEWLGSHPLAGDPEETYARLAALRDADPVAYCTEIEALRTRAKQTEAALDEVIALVRPIFEGNVDTEVPEGTVIDKEDGPSRHIEAALQGEGQLAGLLKALRPIGELRRLADTIVEQRTEATKKAENIRFAVKKADETLKEAEVARAHANSGRAQAESRLGEVRKAHAEVEGTHAAAGADMIRIGEAELKAAGTALAEKRHVAARRHALEACKRFQEAGKCYEQALRYCATLDQAVADASAGIRQAEAQHKTVVDCMPDTRRRVAAAGKIHKDTHRAQRHVDAADSAVANGLDSLRKARETVERKRHAQAKSVADAALGSFRDAAKSLEHADRWCREQDEKKAAYETLAANAERERANAERRIRGAGRKANLAALARPDETGAIDYESRLVEVAAVRAAWERSAAAAEREHADEIRRRAEEEEAAAAAMRRRAQAEEEDRRRAEAASSSYSGGYGSSDPSPSGGGYSPSDSSSGGGDYGSSGSTSGGGDY